MPRIRFRVVWGFGETIATFSPVSRFSSVLLPTLGRPTNAAKPLRVFSVIPPRSDPCRYLDRHSALRLGRGDRQLGDAHILLWPILRSLRDLVGDSFDDVLTLH